MGGGGRVGGSMAGVEGCVLLGAADRQHGCPGPGLVEETDQDWQGDQGTVLSVI